MTPRRQQILETAAALFAERGFHGVSVHEIGAACGISGPALYKHFGSKDELLAASLTDISETLLAEGTARVAKAESPTDALEALVDWHIEFALKHPDLIVVQDREWSNLDPEAQRSVRRIQVRYIDLWVDVLVAHDAATGIEPAEGKRGLARAKVQATFGLLNSTPHSARLQPRSMERLLRSMSLAALHSRT